MAVKQQKKRNKQVLIKGIIDNILHHTIPVTMHLQIQQQPVWDELKAETRQVDVFP